MKNKWKKYHEPKSLRDERRLFEGETTAKYPMPGARRFTTKKWSPAQQRFPSQTRRLEKWTVDPFWEMNQTTLAQQQVMAGPLSAATALNITPQC